MSYECYMNVTFRFCFRSPLKSLKLPVFKGLSTDLGSHSFLHISFYPLYKMKVFLFYRTDNWNSRESKDLVYIGTNREASIKKLMKLESEPITEEQAEDIRRMNQSQCNNVGYEWEVEVWTLNHLSE